MAKVFTVSRRGTTYVVRDDASPAPWCLSSEIMAFMRIDLHHELHPDRIQPVVYLGDRTGLPIPEIQQAGQA